MVRHAVEGISLAPGLPPLSDAREILDAGGARPLATLLHGVGLVITMCVPWGSTHINHICHLTTSPRSKTYFNARRLEFKGPKFTFSNVGVSLDVIYGIQPIHGKRHTTAPWRRHAQDRGHQSHGHAGHRRRQEVGSAHVLLRVPGGPRALRCRHRHPARRLGHRC